MNTYGATGQLFGGNWTEQKLQMLQKYLSAYTTALKKTSFKLAYIDAFAGTGYREIKTEEDHGPLLFEEIAQEEPQKFLDGSARIALKVKPPFHRYVFIEMRTAHFCELDKLKTEFPDKAKAIRLHKGNANDLLQEWSAKTDWNTWRAVAFLDPFGMQIDWATMEAIARTEAIDLWVLFPLGMAVNRLLARDPANIPPSWRARLDRMFGSQGWFEIFYKKVSSSGLLGQHTEIRKVCTMEDISHYYHDKLKSIFTQVADNPRTLHNSKDVPLFQLFFAAGNPKGAPIAVKIAQHILKEK